MLWALTIDYEWKIKTSRIVVNVEVIPTDRMFALIGGGKRRSLVNPLTYICNC